MSFRLDRVWRDVGWFDNGQLAIRGLGIVPACPQVCPAGLLDSSILGRHQHAVGVEPRLQLPAVDEPDCKVIQQLIILRFLGNGFDFSQAQVEFLAIRFSADVSS
jgi:hypothetical protein